LSLKQLRFDENTTGILKLESLYFHCFVKWYYARVCNLSILSLICFPRCTVNLAFCDTYDIVLGIVHIIKHSQSFLSLPQYIIFNSLRDIAPNDKSLLESDNKWLYKETSYLDVVNYVVVINYLRWELYIFLKWKLQYNIIYSKIFSKTRKHEETKTWLGFVWNCHKCILNE
jgi:hypothetical protein